MKIREFLSKGPNIYGLIGIALFSALSIQTRSPWPILVFLLLTVGLGCIGMLVRRWIRVRE